MQATYVILKLSSSYISKKEKEIGEINFNNILYLIQYIQNIITFNM